MKALAQLAMRSPNVVVARPCLRVVSARRSMQCVDTLRHRVFKVERGELQIMRWGPGLISSRVLGHLGVELLPPYLAAFSAATREHTVRAFFDWYEMSTYESECRIQLTRFVLEKRARITSLDILVRSPLTAMGVSTAALLIGGGLLKSHSDPKRFAALLQDVCGVGSPA